MKADPSAQLKLLDLQALDSQTMQLGHQRRSLPELAEIAELEATRADVLGNRSDAQIVVDDLTLAQSKVDADVEQVKARRTRDRDRMDQGLIADPKALERMQHELQTLERRITALEDEELEVMEELEMAQTALDALTTHLTETDERLAELAQARDARLVEIDASLAELAEKREPAVAGLPDDLLALYDKLRAAKGGVGAAELRGGACGGCRLSIDNAELGVIRGTAPEVVVRCEECQRILVRTSESGL